MANEVVYKIEFSLDNELKENSSLSSQIDANSEKENKNKESKAQKEVKKQQSSHWQELQDVATKTVAAVGIGYDLYLSTRNFINSVRMVNLGVSGDFVSAKNLQIQTARNDKIISQLSTVLTPAITAGIAGGPVAFLGGLALGTYKVAKDIITANINASTQQLAFVADQQLKSYVNNLEREKLVKNMGYYR